jgi:hypothetical protein
MILRQIILGGLLLPFKIYFQPNSFVDEISGLAPEMPRKYSLWQARHKLREQQFRLAVLVLLAQSSVAMFWIVAILCLGSGGMPKANWALAVVLTAAMVVSFLAFGLILGIVFDVAFGVALGVVGSIGFGIVGSIVGDGVDLLGPDVASGIASGVLNGIAFGLAFSVMGGVTGVVKKGYKRGFTRGFAVGSILGSVLGIVIGILLGIGASITKGIVQGIVYGVVGGVMLSIISGIALGFMFGIAGSFMFAVGESIPGLIVGGVGLGIWFGLSGSFVHGITRSAALGISLTITFALTVSHLLTYPIQCCMSYVIWLFSRGAPLRLLWLISPAHWDEIIILPLPGLSQLLIDLYHRDPVGGKNAIDELSRHRYQSKVAYQALAELAFAEAQRLTTLAELASYERGLNWAASETPLPDLSKTLLLSLKEISQMIDAAQQSDTARNKISQLRLAAEKVNALRQYPVEASKALTRWQTLIAEGLARAEEERRILEPIRQVYFNDGAPISPDDLPEEDLPFKGRLETVRELEGALSAAKRATLLLTGNRRSGKSSLLRQLPRKLGPQVLPAFLDCQSPKFVSSESAGGLLFGLAAEMVAEARRNAEKFRRDPVKFPRLDREAFNHDPYPAFNHWLEGAERALGERQLLLCLDEFEKLDEAIATGRIDGRFLSMLRNIMQHHHRIIVLLAGSHHLDELSPRWADALITTQSLKIGFLDEADARELIVQPVKGFPEIYQPEAVERILMLTHAQPYLVQLLCGLLVEKMNREHREPPASYVSLTDIEAVIPQALERGEAYFNDLWRSQTGGKIAQRVLERLAFAEVERATGAEIKRVTEDEDALSDTIRTLLRREIIESTADGYHITVPLIGYYVRSQRQPV